MVSLSTCSRPSGGMPWYLRGLIWLPMVIACMGLAVYLLLGGKPCCEEAVGDPQGQTWEVQAEGRIGSGTTVKTLKGMRVITAGHLWRGHEDRRPSPAPRGILRQLHPFQEVPYVLDYLVATNEDAPFGGDFAILIPEAPLDGPSAVFVSRPLVCGEQTLCVGTMIGGGSQPQAPFFGTYAFRRYFPDIGGQRIVTHPGGIPGYSGGGTYVKTRGRWEYAGMILRVNRYFTHTIHMPADAIKELIREYEAQ